MSRLAQAMLSLSVVVLGSPAAIAGVVYTFTDLGATANNFPSPPANTASDSGAQTYFGPTINATGEVTATAGDGQTTRYTNAILFNGTTTLNLGLLPGGDGSFGDALNAAGQVTGDASTNGDGDPHAFRATGSALADLGTLPGGLASHGAAINDSGQVAGWSNSASNSTGQRAVIWTGNTIQNLGTLGGNGSAAVAINNSGQAAGDSFTSNAQEHAFFWNGKQMTDIGTLAGQQTNAVAMNQTGEIVGDSNISNSAAHAFLWNGTSMQDLGTFGGDASLAEAINAGGEVVGSAETGGVNQVFHAFLWNGTSLINLDPSLSCAGDGTATAINAAGDVVGFDCNGAFLFANGDLSYLNSLLPTAGIDVVEATSINDLNDIAAVGIVESGPDAGQVHNFLLTQTARVPEPSAFALFLSVLGLVLLVRRSRVVRL